MTDDPVIQENVPPPRFDLSKLPCCGTQVFKLREGATAWYCNACGKDTPQAFLDQMIEADPNFKEVLDKAIRTANQKKPDVEVVLRKPPKPIPTDPAYLRAQAKIDAFMAGVNSASDKFALCPYVEGTPAHTEWHRGRDKADQIKAARRA